MRGKALLLVCLVGVLLMSACGGGDGGQGTETPATPLAEQVRTFTNEEWRFSLEYPAEWARDDTPAKMFGGGDFDISLGDPALLDDPADAVAERFTQVNVGAMRLPREGSEYEIRSVLEALATQFEDMAGKAPTSGNPYFEVTESAMGRLAGAPCLILDMTVEFDYLKGRPFHLRQYNFGKGDVLYSLGLLAPENHWAEHEARLESIAESFVILK